MGNRKAVVILSGGMDSAVLLHHVARHSTHVRALSFDYGQRHRKELDQARLIVQDLMSRGLPNIEELGWTPVDLSAIRPLIAKGSQTGEEEVPEGHYAEESMKLTVVPNRNMIMLSVAIGYAITLGYDTVAYGAHAGDHTIYPDCRGSYVEAMAEAIRLCDFDPPTLRAPFVEMGKHEVCRLGRVLGVPFELTWSCYKGGEKHCGKCGTCVERKEAFVLANVHDPTEYAA